MAKITEAIIILIAGDIIYHTLEDLTKAVSNVLGEQVNLRSIQKAINRNRHRITYENNRFAFTFEYESKR